MRVVLRSFSGLLVLLVSLPAVAEPRDAEATLRAELITAIQRRDVDAVKSRVQMPLEAKELRFLDGKCADFTSPYAAIEDHELATFVGCLADIGIAATPGAELGDATYGPGAILILDTFGGKLRSLSSIDPGNDQFMIEPGVFASHVRKFKRSIAPSAALKKTLDASTDARALASVMVCVDLRGKITSLEIEVEGDATYEREVRTAARAWSVKPFRVGKQAVPACAALTLGYPAQRLTTPPRPAAPDAPPVVAQPATSTTTTAPRNVPPTLLEGSRISGEPVILPDETTKNAIRDSGANQVIGSFKLCIDTAGAVTKIVTLKTTGFEPYDKTLIRGMRQWKYRPYNLDGKPVPVCTAITFVYKQTVAR